MRGENFVAHLDGLSGTPVCRGTPVAHHCLRISAWKVTSEKSPQAITRLIAGEDFITSSHWKLQIVIADVRGKNWTLCPWFCPRFVIACSFIHYSRDFPAPGRNCMTHRQALQDFPDTSQVSLHKNKINVLFNKRCWKLCPCDSCVLVYQWTHCILI
jgi:hypothetical protein